MPNGNSQMIGIVVVMIFLIKQPLHGMAHKLQSTVVQIVLKNASTNQHVSHSITPSLETVIAGGNATLKRAHALGKIVVGPLELGNIIL